MSAIKPAASESPNSDVLKIANGYSNNPKSAVDTMTWDQAKFTLQVKAFRSKEEAASFLFLP